MTERDWKGTFCRVLPDGRRICTHAQVLHAPLPVRVFREQVWEHDAPEEGNKLQGERFWITDPKAAHTTLEACLNVHETPTIQ